MAKTFLPSFPSIPLHPHGNGNAVVPYTYVKHVSDICNPTLDKEDTQCCSAEGQFVDRRSLNEHCYPIIVPEDDPIHQLTRTRCMNFVRTITTRDRNCVGGYEPAEQVCVNYPLQFYRISS